MIAQEGLHKDMELAKKAREQVSKGSLMINLRRAMTVDVGQWRVVRGPYDRRAEQAGT